MTEDEYNAIRARMTEPETEAVTYEPYWQAHAEQSARQGLGREHAGHGLPIPGGKVQVQAQAEHGDPEAGQ